MSAIKGIFNDGALIDVHVCAWSGSKMLTAEDMGMQDSEVPEAYKLGVKMLVPDEIITEFRKIEGRARRAADFPYGLKFPIGSSKFVPKNNIPRVVEALKQCQEEYTALAEKLANNLEEYRLQMIPVYEEAALTAYLQQKPEGVETFSIDDEEARKNAFVDQFMARIKSYYPDPQSLKCRFSLDWTVYEIGESTSEFAQEEWKQQARAKIGSFIDDVVGQLRTETVTICNHVASAIKEGKIIRSSTIDTLKTFIDKFKGLNFVGDAKIEQELTQFKTDVLDPHSPEQLSSPEMQTEMKRRLAIIAEVASDISDVSAVSGTYRRKIAWEQ
jgi:hypothetical protein